MSKYSKNKTYYGNIPNKKSRNSGKTFLIVTYYFFKSVNGTFDLSFYKIPLPGTSSYVSYERNLVGEMNTLEPTILTNLISEISVLRIQVQE